VRPAGVRDFVRRKEFVGTQSDVSGFELAVRTHVGEKRDSMTGLLRESARVGGDPAAELSRTLPSSTRGR